jgi:hypothetical protein
MLTVYADVTGRANFHFHWRVDKAMLLNTLTDELNSPGKGRVGYPPFPFFAKLLIRRDLAAEVSVKSSNETGYRQNPHSIALICHTEVGLQKLGTVTISIRGGTGWLRQLYLVWFLAFGAFEGLTAW